MTKRQEKKKPPPPEPKLTRMAKLRDDLVGVFLDEARPDGWPSAETMQGRGDRLWLKRNAEATGRLAVRASQLIALLAVTQPYDKPEMPLAEGWLDKEVSRLNDEAMRILERHRARQGGLRLVPRA